MNLNHKTAKYLLIMIVAARATSFCFSKICLQTVTPYRLLGIRFTLAFVLLAAVFYKNLIRDFSVSDMEKGVCFGVIYFLVVFCEYSGLKTTNSSTASFIENMAIVIVPFLNVPFSHKKPLKKDVICAFIAFIGIGFLTLTNQGLAVSGGELFLIGAAFFYAIAIVVTNLLSKKGNTLNMGIYQVGTIGILGLAFSSVSNTLVIPNSVEIYICILILAIVCTGFGYTLQPVAQSKLKAEEVSLFCAINPLVASIIGCLFLHEYPTVWNLIGELLIISVLVIHR